MVAVAIREPALAALSGEPSASADGGLVESDERPDECECTELCKFPCWYCYAEGFEQPNPKTAEE